MGRAQRRWLQPGKSKGRERGGEKGAPTALADGVCAWPESKIPSKANDANTRAHPSRWHPPHDCHSFRRGHANTPSGGQVQLHVLPTASAVPAPLRRCQPLLTGRKNARRGVGRADACPTLSAPPPRRPAPLPPSPPSAPPPFPLPLRRLPARARRPRHAFPGRGRRRLLIARHTAAVPTPPPSAAAAQRAPRFSRVTPPATPCTVSALASVFLACPPARPPARPPALPPARPPAGAASSRRTTTACGAAG